MRRHSADEGLSEIQAAARKRAAQDRLDRINRAIAELPKAQAAIAALATKGVIPFIPLMSGRNLTATEGESARNSRPEARGASPAGAPRKLPLLLHNPRARRTGWWRVP